MSASLTASRSERRTTLRQQSRAKNSCRLTRNTGEGPWMASIRNVSPGGIGLIANRQFKRGMFLTVELPTAQGTIPKLVRIAHAAPQPGGAWWVIGGTFASPLTTEEMNSLI